MSRRRREQTELRSLDPTMVKDFAPLDVNEPPMEERGPRIIVSPLSNNPINLVWIPAVVGLFAIEMWLQVPTPVEILSFVALLVIFIGLWRLVDKRSR